MTEVLDYQGWRLRLRRPAGETLRPVWLLLHGWTGDENVMWVFANRLPEDVWILAPRGLHATPLGGYGWQPELHKGWPAVADLALAAEGVLDLVRLLAADEQFSGADFSRLHLMGFSQGAALAGTLALTQPGRFRSLSMLAGFLPNGAGEFSAARPLAGLPVFVAHGTQDQLVPVARARQAVELLESGGGQVTYCEAEVGHKLSRDCLHGMLGFVERVKES